MKCQNPVSVAGRGVLTPRHLLQVPDNEPAVAAQHWRIAMTSSCPRLWAILLAPILLIVGDAIPYGSHIKWVQDSGDGFLLGLVSRNSKASTVDFTDSHGGICPQSASFIFSSGQEFAIVAPVHAGPLDSKEEKNEESSLFLFGNEACRYKITLKKFVWKSGRETQLPLRSRDALKRGVEAEL